MKDLHMHTVFSDGQNTPEEMVQEAIRLGLDTVGISDHSHLDPCGMTLESSAEYRKEIARLKEKYAGQIRVLCGLERDFISDDFAEYDYVIGSVHLLTMPDGHHVSIDWTAEKQREGVEKYFGGDWYAFAEAYYGLVGRVVEVTKCDIIGHFDLITKFIEQNQAFDVKHPRYVKAWQQAADTLLRTGKPILMIPASFLCGAVFCVLCDLAARTLFAPVELSISTVTSAVGAPVVIWLMLSRRRKHED